MIDVEEERAVRMLATRGVGAAAASRCGVASSTPARRAAEPEEGAHVSRQRCGELRGAARAGLGRDHDLRPRLASRAGRPLGPGHGELVRESRGEAGPAPRVDGHAHRGLHPGDRSCSASSRHSTTAGCARSCSSRWSPTTVRTASSSAARRRATSTSPASRCSRSPSARSGRASGRSTTPSTSPSRSTPRRRSSSTAVVGIGGAALFLLAFWRPPKKDDSAA